MAFFQRESSRAKASPAKLFLFRGSDPTAESLVRSVTLIPGATEFGYGTTAVVETWTESVGGTDFPRETPLNRLGAQDDVDLIVSVEDLLSVFPELTHVNLVVSWFGTNLQCGNCSIEPKVTDADLVTTPYSWNVGGLTRADVGVVSAVSGKAAFGGSPSDRTIFEAIEYLKAKGLRVTLHPMVLMDIPAGNALTDPYGDVEQAAFPWRGRITCHPAPEQPGTVQGSATAEGQVDDFFDSYTVGNFSWDATEKHVIYSGAATFGYERFVMHMATVAAAAGVDDFLMGSELAGLTKVRGAGAGNYPAVSHLQSLAAKVRSIVGAGVRVSYAADWSEYHSDKYDGNVYFNLDPLWSDSEIDYIGINNFFPIADWRDGKAHLDWQAGYTSIYDVNYLKANIEGGELFDWVYATDADRTNQVRTPITDVAYAKPWVFRQKDLRSWWENAHYNRPSGVEAVSPTGWTPESKPIVFTELGCACVEKGPNQPDVTYDVVSSESALPHFSNGRPDAAIQRAYLEAVLAYWRPGNGNNDDGMIEWDSASIWTWDARPYPFFPKKTTIYTDAANWTLGPWLTGRMVPGRAFESGSFGPYAFTDAEEAITRAGITYIPRPIKHSDIENSSDLDKSTLTVSMARDVNFMNEFIAFPPSQVVNLTIFQGHVEDDVSLSNYPAIWLGRVSAPEVEGNELKVACIPVSTTIQRPGLRRNYQLGCPHVLYGPQCRADKKAATVTREVASKAGAIVVLTSALGALYLKFIGGTIEWTREDGQREIRTITNVAADGVTLSIRGTLRGLIVGEDVLVTLGCNRSMADCLNTHDNIVNYGGQPFIPLDNPLSQKNQFY